MELPKDPFILELLPEFLETWISDVQTQLPDILAKRDEQALYRFGHTVKGSCAQFGLGELSGMGIELMGYAKSGDWTAAAAMKSRLAAGFDEAKRFVDQQLS